MCAQIWSFQLCMYCWPQSLHHCCYLGDTPFFHCNCDVAHRLCPMRIEGGSLSTYHQPSTLVDRRRLASKFWSLAPDTSSVCRTSMVFERLDWLQEGIVVMMLLEYLLKIWSRRRIGWRKNMFLLDMNTRQSYRTNTAFCSVWCSLFWDPFIVNVCLW